MEFFENVKKSPGFLKTLPFQTGVLTMKCIHLLGLFTVIDLYYCYTITVD